MKWISDALIILGAAGVTTGAALWSPAFGFAVGGGFMLGAGGVLAYIGYGNKAKTDAA